MATVLDSEMAKNIEIGKKVTITLSSGTEINASISYTGKQSDDKVLIVFDLNTLTDELIEYRKISFNITWWSASGLKVPNTAVLEDKDGFKYVVRKKAGQEQKAIVKVLNKNDKYSIISAYSTGELEQLGIDSKNYNKIGQYDSVLVYPESK